MWAFHDSALWVLRIITASSTSKWCNEQENPVTTLVKMEIVMFVLPHGPIMRIISDKYVCIFYELRVLYKNIEKYILWLDETYTIPGY